MHELNLTRIVREKNEFIIKTIFSDRELCRTKLNKEEAFWIAFGIETSYYDHAGPVFLQLEADQEQIYKEWDLVKSKYNNDSEYFDEWFSERIAQ